QFFHDSLYEAVPQFFDRYEEALQAHCADASVDARPSIQFHSWIGGDRDGNPNVTSEVTARSLAAGRQAALASHIAAVRSVGHRLSVSARIAQIPAAALAAIRSIVPEEDPLAQRNPGELFRQACFAVAARLERTSAGAGGYAAPYDYERDLAQIERALDLSAASRMAKRYIRPLRRAAEVFGFRSYALDVRQNSAAINAALAEVWGEGAQQRARRTGPDACAPNLAMARCRRLIWAV
ncbi:MAG: phosphoenolpyruvate carboxylase, partial [Paracoccaceae bacterium]